MRRHIQLVGLCGHSLSARKTIKVADVKIHFKNLNPSTTTTAIAVGNQLLQQMSKRLKGSIRASDTVGRIGGDEFVLLIGELTGPDAIIFLADKIRQAVRRPYSIDGHELYISCSLGIAIYPDDGADEVALTMRADEAMYRAKEGGR